MIDCFNCLITLLITLCRVISEKNKAANALITFEEIVML